MAGISFPGSASVAFLLNFAFRPQHIAPVKRAERQHVVEVTAFFNRDKDPAASRLNPSTALRKAPSASTGQRAQASPAVR